MFLGGLVGAETCCQTVQKVGEVRLEIIRPEIVEAVGGGQVTVRQNRRFQGDSEPSFRLEIHGSAGCSLGRHPRPQHQKSKIQVASFPVFEFLAKPGRESPQRQAPKNVFFAKKCGVFAVFGGVVGAETCCQTVQKVGEVPR